MKTTKVLAHTADNKGTVGLGETIHRARVGDAITRWINDAVPGADVSVLNDPSTIICTVESGKQVFITRLSVAILTASDSCHFNMVGCSQVLGGGTATDLAGHLHIYSSGNLAGTENRTHVYDPPLRVRYSDGYRSISVKVDPSDASVILGAEWQGWIEDE